MDSHHSQSSNQGGGDRPPNTDHWHSRVPRPPLVNHQQRGNRHNPYHRQWSAYTPYRHSIQPDQRHGHRRQSDRNQYTHRATQPPRAQTGRASTNTQSSNLIQCTPSATQPPRAQAGQSSTSISSTLLQGVVLPPARAEASQSSTCTPSDTPPHGAALPPPRAQAGQLSTSTHKKTQPARAQAFQPSTNTQSSTLSQSTHTVAQPARTQPYQSSTSTYRAAQSPRGQASQPSTSTPSPILPAGPKPHNQSAVAQSHQVKQSQSHASNTPCSIDPGNKVPSKRKSLMPNVVNQKKHRSEPDTRYRHRSEVAMRLKSCTVPPEQLEYAEYTEELKMNLTLKKKDSDYEIQMYDLSCAVCAFINTCGGLVLIKPMTTYKPRDLENFKNNIKQTLESFLGHKMVKSCIKIEPKLDDKNRLRIKVTKGRSKTNVYSNFCMREDCTTIEIKELEEIKNILSHCHEPVPYDEATATDRWKGLKYEEQIHIDESKTLEYKCYRECDTVEDLLEKMTKNTALEKTLFAFANQPDGGELIIGIRDDNRTGDKQVIGQKLPDEATFRNRFATFMTEGDDGRERIWGKIGHKPRDGKEWSINFISVDDVPQNDRRVLIHIRVNYFPGGVFAACPEAYTVLPDGDAECLDYKAWCDLVFSAAFPSVPAATAVCQGLDEPTEKDVELEEDTQSVLADELRKFTEENRKRTPPSVSWTRYSDIWERDKQKLQVENHDMRVSMLQYSSLLTLQKPLDFFPPKNHLLANDFDGKIADSLEDICKYYRETPAVAFGGFSISSLFPALVISPPSESHVMDLCVLRADGIDIWTIIGDTTSADNHSTYLASIMRCLKRILLSESHADVPIKGFVKILGQSEPAIERQTMPGDNQNKLDFRKAFSDLLKNGNTWMKNRFGEDILVMLTRAQMECILASELAQFSIINGPPGSGKTLMAFHLIQNLKQIHGLKSHQIKYICPNIALAEYARSQKLCEVGVSAGDQEMLEMIQKDIREGIHHFVLDDQHKIICETNEWTEMCDILTIQEREHNIKIHMTIFRDSAFQHYGDEESTFMKAINKYKEKHDTFPLLINSHLYEMLRNCGKVFSFFKAYAGEDEGKLQCKNGVMGDDIGIHSHDKSEMLSQGKSNPALSILNEILQGDHHGHIFERKDVAVLLDFDDQKVGESIERNVRGSIQKEFGSDSVQDASKFPVTDIILDSLVNFSGLDAKACVLIVKDQKINKNRYKMYAASRGILRVDFLLVKEGSNPRGLEAFTKKMHISDDQIWKQRTNLLHQQLRLHLQCHTIEAEWQDWINNHVPTKQAWSWHLGSLSAVHKGSLNSVPCGWKKKADFLVGYLSRMIRKYLEQQNLDDVLKSGLKHDISCVDDEASMLHVIHQITCCDSTVESQIFDELLSDGLFTALASVLLRDQLSSESDGTLSKEILSVINKHCSEDKLRQQLLDEVGQTSNRQLFLWMKTFLPEQLHSKQFLQICAKNLQTTGSNLMESIESSQWPSITNLELLSLGQDAISCDSSPAVIVDSLNLIHLGIMKLQNQAALETDQPKLKECMESLIQVLDKYKANSEIVKQTLTAIAALMKNKSITQDMLQKEWVAVIFTALRQHDVAFIVTETILTAVKAMLKQSGEAKQATIDQGLIPVLLHVLQQNDSKCVTNILATLNTVMEESREARQAAVDLGLIPILHNSLQNAGFDTQVEMIILETLNAVMKESAQARQAVLDQGLIPVLLNSLKKAGYQTEFAIMVGKTIVCAITYNKELAEKMIELLLDTLQEYSQTKMRKKSGAVYNILITLSTVIKENEEARQAAVDQRLFPVLLQLLEHPGTGVLPVCRVRDAIVSAITDNKELAERIVKLLLNSLQQSTLTKKIILNVLNTLRGVMKVSEEVRRAAVDQGLIPLLLNLLQQHGTDTQIIIKTLHTVGEIGETRQAVVKQGMFHFILQLLLQSNTDTKMIENVLKTLNTMMEENVEARRAAVDQGLIPVLLQLLQPGKASWVVEAAAHTLEILAKDSLIKLNDIEPIVSVLKCINEKFNRRSRYDRNAKKVVDQALQTIREKYGLTAPASSTG